MQDHLYSQIIEHGFSVLPLQGIKSNVCTCGKPKCSSPGKHPLKGFRWKQAASTNKTVVNQWWEQAKNGVHNIGVVTGCRSKINNKCLVVVDVDDSAHDIINKLPKTFTYRTGKGGFHFWFWSDIPVKNSVSLIAAKVDIRGTNGYVVVPPSSHVSGNEYVVVNTSPIVDLPKFIQELVKQAHIANKTEKTTPKKKGELSKLSKEWAKVSIQEIKAFIAKKGKIPCGVRNSTIHRLLSSDRAKGVLSRDELWKNADSYRKSIEESNTMNDSELNAIVGSVMKYQPYNNMHTNVNKLYVRWMKKNGHKLPDGYEKTLEETDAKFFLSIKESKKGMSLAEIVASRESFLVSKGLLHRSNYKPSLLGKKLREMGFERVRTSKCNLWNVSIDIQPKTALMDNHDDKFRKESIHKCSSGVRDYTHSKSSGSSGLLSDRPFGRSRTDDRGTAQESSNNNLPITFQFTNTETVGTKSG